MAPRWTPFVGTDTLANGETCKSCGFERFYKNSLYAVLVRRVMMPPPFGRTVHLSIRRNDRRPIHDWRDLQRIKIELVGPEAEAIEVYPGTSRIVDASNQYHLWVPIDLDLSAFGLAHREVCDTKEADAMGAVQRPWDEEALQAFGGLGVADAVREAEEVYKARQKKRRAESLIAAKGNVP